MNKEKSFYYYRDSEWKGGWGVKHKNGKIITLTFHQHFAAAVADALNHYADTRFVKRSS